MNRRQPELAAGFVCLLILALWRLGYPLTSAASGALAAAFLLVMAALYRRRIAVTLALREAVFLPHAPARRWFTGRVTGGVTALFEAGAITLTMAHFILHASPPELALAAVIGAATLAMLALLRRMASAQLRPDFALIAGAWIAIGVAIPASLVHFCMHLRGLLPEPAFLENAGFRAMLGAALADLPVRRDGIIEALGLMRIIEATTLYALHALHDIWGAPLLFLLYSAGICIAIARFFADIACVVIRTGVSGTPR